MHRYIFFVTSLLLSLSGCVSTKTHQAVVNELEKTHQSLEGTHQELHRARLNLDEARQELIDLEIQKQDLEADLARLDVVHEELNLQLAMAKELEDEINRPNQVYEEFAKRLQGMIDTGQLTVKIQNGRIAIQLPSNVLFESGRARLSPGGRRTLRQIAKVLVQFSDRRFQIEGHTDNMPIKSSRFPSNWELSATRALTVLHLLVDAGVPSQNLSAAGFGEFQPRASNDTPQGRQFNRRIEIVMLPNLEVISGEFPNLGE